MIKQRKTKGNRLSAADWFDLLFVTVGGITLDLFLQHRLHDIRPAAYAGFEAL